jgi:Domain of unknown function (DUF4340)
VSWKGTLSLLTLAAVSIIILFFSRNSHTRTAGEPLLTLNPPEVVKIALRESGGEIILCKNNGTWIVESSQLAVSDRADPSIIRSLLEQGAEIRVLDTLLPHDLKSSVSLESLDLKIPKRSLSFFEGKDGSAMRISFGINGSAQGQIYAKLDTVKTVFLIPSEIVTTAFRPAEEFRDQRLTALNADRLEEISLSKENTLQCLSLQKGYGGWNITCPMKARGNNSAVSDWAKSLLSKKITQWMPASTDPTACGMDAPFAVISARELGESSRVTITIGATVPDSSESRYVHCSDRPGICMVSGLSTLLEVTPSTFRARQPKPLQLDAVDKIGIHPSTAAEAPLVIKRKKGSDSWEINDGGTKTLTSLQVAEWFEKLQSLTAISFESATPQKLESSGLTHPTTIRLIAHLSENTAEESEGDLTLAEYSFGTPLNGVVSFREGGASDLMILPANAIELTHGPEVEGNVLKR